MTSDGESVGEWALKYATLPIPIFPCSPETKRPLTEHGFKDAVDDTDQVAVWWRQTPSAMIGMPTGERTDMFVLDVDNKNGHDGEAALAALVAKFGPLPPTRSAITGTGGRHIYFKHPGFTVQNSASKIADGLDIRGDGGYVILPPSVRADGTFYEWDRPGLVARAPEWLLDLIRAAPAPDQERYPEADTISDNYAQGALSKEVDNVRRCGPGSRNHTLNVAAHNLGQFLASGTLTRDQIIGALFNASIDNGEVADDGRAQVLATIESGLRAGAAKPRKLKAKSAPPHKHKHTATLNGSAPHQEPESAPPVEVVSDDWRDKLITSSKGIPKPLLANAIIALRHAPEWQGVLSFDTFQQKTIVTKVLPWLNNFAGQEFWTDTHDLFLTDWLQHAGISIGPGIAAEAADVVSKDHKVHPVLSYLGSLSWDGIPRLDEWTIKYLGAVDTPYARAVSAKWMISAVARIHTPGCKADCALILEGPQGMLKSTAVRVISIPWFTDEIAEFGSKDAGMQMAGVWIIELAELDAMGRAEIKAIKAFMSRRIDRFRLPYGRRIEEFPRQCVFIGTCNMNDYLLDETGGRRFWPLECTKIDIEALTLDRDQLWAEAQHRFYDGETWWLDTDDIVQAAAAEQRGRYHEDAWQPLVETFLIGHGETSVHEILKDALSLPRDKWSRNEQMRVAKVLKFMGWQRKKTRDRGWVYLAPDLPQPV